MATFVTFEDIEGWQMARRLTFEIYGASKKPLFAKGSAGEVISHLYVALDQGYINHDEFRSLEKAARDTGRKIGGLMSYLRQSDLRGPKYKASTRRERSGKRL